MGAEKIKRMIKQKYDITLDIKGNPLDQITREAMAIEYQKANPSVKEILWPG